MIVYTFTLFGMNSKFIHLLPKARHHYHFFTTLNNLQPKKSGHYQIHILIWNIWKERNIIFNNNKLNIHRIFHEDKIMWTELQMKQTIDILLDPISTQITLPIITSLSPQLQSSSSVLEATTYQLLQT